MNATPSASADEIRVWLIDKLCDELGLDPSEVGIDEAFASFGIDSVQAVSICGDLEVWTGRPFPATLLWDFPTIRILSEHLARPSASAAVGDEQGLEKAKEPIAVIGLGCRFPGANSPADFWALLRDGVDAVSEVPPGRWDADAYYDPDPAAPGKMNSRWGGFLDNVDRFDAQFFGISPREAARMDPQQRLLLEVAWEALEDAGQVPSLLAGSRTGVFVGIGTIDYGRMQMRNLRTASNPYAGTGCALSVAANRISYVFNFRGPSVAVDTACSSSLVATHLACQSLWSGESSLALAGGVNVIIDPKTSVALAKGGFLSPDGRCRAFDSRANGYVRAEGAGVVVLKLLSKALEDGDPIYALVRSTAVNQDGHSNGLTAPNQQSQELLLREAYRLAGISPGHVQYVEAHGTGTSLGDPIEVKALGTVLGIDRPEGTRCALGSVKSNVGHAETAAGLVSLIKVALMMKHRAIPASLHFREPNPHIPFDTLPLYVQESFGPWPEGNGPAIAGINSFGFGGTNAHVVVSEAPAAPRAPRPERETGRAQLLALSARDPEALKALAGEYLSLAGDETARPRLEDLAFTCGARRGHYDHRLALVARSWAEVEDGLDAFLKGETRPGTSHRRRASGRWPKVAFVFSGQGSQREQMGRQLLEQEPVFRARIEECDALFRRHSGWSLVEQLHSGSRIDETEVTQPAIFMLQVALAALLESWGIRPDAVVGHSLGEIAAAHVSGALSLDDAIRAIYHRGRLMQQTAGRGGTAAVGLSLDETRELLSAYEGRLSIAAHNGPRLTTISGEIAALDEVLASLRQKGTFGRKLRADHAFHSAQMDPLLPELEDALDGIRPDAGPIPFFSTVTGGRFEGANLTAAYWSRNLREPVLFADAVGAMLEDGYEVFLEVSPTSVLAGTVSRCASEAGYDAVVLPALREGEEERSSMLGALGTLHTMGLPVDWRRLFEEGSRCVPLPHYPWQRERYWLEADDESAEGAGEEMPAGVHPLLGRHLEAAQHQGTHFWQCDLNPRLLPWLSDHQLQGAALLPATAYVEMALAAAAEVFDGTPIAVSEIELRKALFLGESETHTLQTILYPGTPGQAHFRIYSRRAGDDAPGSWSLHAAGQARAADIDGTTAATPPEQIRAVCTREIAGPEFYDALRSRGFDYGPAFQGVERIWYRPGEALGRIRVTQPIERDLGEYRLHPAVLDACTQVLGAAASILASGESDGLYVPVGFAQVRAFESTGSQFWSHVTLRDNAGRASASADGLKPVLHTLHADIRLLDDAGRVLAEVSGVRCVRLERTAAQEERKVGDWLYEIAWQPAADAVGERTEPEVAAGLWLLLTDSAGVGARLQELLEARGEACVSVSPGDDFGEVLAGLSELAGAPLRVVHLWNLDLPAPGDGADFDWKASVDHGCISLLHLVQALVRNGWDQTGRLWVVTRGAHAVDGESAVAIAQTPASGLAGVIAAEVPRLGCVRVDLDPEGGDGEVQRLLDELLRNAEPQIALRGSGRFVPRLVRSERNGAASETSPGAAHALEVPDAEAFRLEISPPYVFDNLSLRPFARRRPGKGEVEIEVLAAGLNFRDVLKAMGLYPGLGDGEVRLGDECAGRVVAIGEGVERFRVGDEVLAIASNGFGSHVTVDTHFVVPRPEGMSFEEAATIPVAYSTAFYALHHVGRLQKGEKVLIHAAAGGVGLAAIGLAQSMGAEIFATAGSDAKREYLQSLGVQHVLDSRSLDWAQEVLGRTGGEGVDVILNSLAGEAIRAGLASLRPFGRFVEIGKIDIYENSQVGLYPFRNNVAFSAVDMEQLFVRRPDLCQSILDELMARFRRGELRPVPHTVFPVTEAAGAFRYMAQRKNTGKIVLTFEQQRRPEDQDARAIVHAGGTYLITGGLGGLGLKVARHLVDIGARNLALIGRGEPSEEARAALSAMREAGAGIHIGKVDVADHGQLAAFLSNLPPNLPPLRGVVHAAGVLDDGIVMQLDEDRFYKVLRPKIAGAWNLHRATSGQPLDFFVLFSSIASVFSNPGQGNYVAANSFLDALAHYRRARGLPAVSINWGPWSEVGMASHLDPRRLEARGMGSVSPDEGVRALEALLDDPPPQVAVLPVGRARWERWSDAPSIAALLSLMAGGGGSRARSEEGGINRGTILSADASERQRLLETYLCDAGGRILGMATSKLDVEQPLNRMGVDSLMAVELKHRVEADLGVDLPVLKVLEGSSMRHLASLLVERLGTAAR